MIKLQVIGHLGKDAVVNDVSGNKVINFTVAHSESYKDKDGNKMQKTVWVECAKWGDKIAVAQYLKKGGQVFAEGIPEITTFQRNDGTTGTSLRLRVMDLQLLGSSNGSEAKPAAAATGAVAPNGAAQSDDLPF